MVIHVSVVSVGWDQGRGCGDGEADAPYWEATELNESNIKQNNEPNNTRSVAN